ncbi:GCR1-dependent translation factor 1 [Oleoguttula sp. CCFEE 5521]
MRYYKPIPLLLLLSSPCFVSAADSLSNDEILALNAPKGEPIDRQGKAQKATNAFDLDADFTRTARAAVKTRHYVGTEDAPVDGLDGKPHAGPFVDTTPEQTSSVTGTKTATATAKALPTSLEKLAGGASSGDGLKLEDIPEKNDGVMNDDTRPIPKKGTTGTEGGVSEKEKARLAKGVNAENIPTGPQEAPPLPHSEVEKMSGKSDKGESKSSKLTKTEGKETEKSGKQVESPKKGGEYGAGFVGMQKPTDLPEKPHDIPHPEPKIATQPKKDSSDPPATDRSTWLKDTMPYTEGVSKPKTPSSSTPGAPGTPEHAASFEEWFHSFVVSFTMIIFTEIGDKTFLVAALMAMRHPRLVVYTAAISALITMTVLSAVLGHIAPTLLPKRLTTLAAAILFLVFGIKMLREGLEMSKEAGVAEEMQEVEAELEEKEHTLLRDSKKSDPYALESGRTSRSPSPARKPQSLSGLANLLGLVLSPVWVQTFVMTFLGEWGDRSQIATIAMAAGQDYWWVTLGAVAGHACCTGLAVLGGRALAGRVSMRVVTIGGAGAFLVFGVLYLYEAWVEG